MHLRPSQLLICSLDVGAVAHPLNRGPFSRDGTGNLLEVMWFAFEIKWRSSLDFEFAHLQNWTKSARWMKGGPNIPIMLNTNNKSTHNWRKLWGSWNWATIYYSSLLLQQAGRAMLQRFEKFLTKPTLCGTGPRTTVNTRTLISSWVACASNRSIFHNEWNVPELSFINPILGNLSQQRNIQKQWLVLFKFLCGFRLHIGAFPSSWRTTSDVRESSLIKASARLRGNFVGPVWFSSRLDEKICLRR